MTAFDYLTVLVSIVVGLAMANVLGGLALLMHARERVVPYWPTLAWAIWLFVVAIQHWWAQWSARHAMVWTFATFLLELAVPVVLFLLSSLALPPRDDGGPIDLEAWFFKNRPWFFALLFFVPAFSILEELARSGHIASLANLVFLLVFEAVAVVAFFARNRRVQEWLCAQVMAMTLVYVGLLFVRLPQ